MIGGLALLLAGLGAWLWSRGHRDPREWPADLSVEATQVREAAKEALEAGKRAAARREAEIDRELEPSGALERR